MTEPVLDARDHQAWAAHMRMAAVHARTTAHRRRVDVARCVIREFHATHPNAILMWSAGKDSTAMCHLAAVDLALPVSSISQKDDLDYPGEREYVSRLASAWGLPLRIVEPPISLRAWLKDHGAHLIGADVHGRTSEMSKIGFYDLVEQAAQGRPIYLGMRAKESRGRALNRALRGHTYVKACGQAVCQPLADWHDIDVYAYLLTHGVPMLDVYKCCGFMHASDPGRVRKSWWVPGSHAARGQVAWLRRYWPSLYADLVEMMPGVEALG